MQKQCRLTLQRDLLGSASHERGESIRGRTGPAVLHEEAQFCSRGGEESEDSRTGRALPVFALAAFIYELSATGTICTTGFAQDCLAILSCRLWCGMVTNP